MCDSQHSVQILLLLFLINLMRILDHSLVPKMKKIKQKKNQLCVFRWQKKYSVVDFQKMIQVTWKSLDKPMMMMTSILHGVLMQTLTVVMMKTCQMKALKRQSRKSSFQQHKTRSQAKNEQM